MNIHPSHPLRKLPSIMMMTIANDAKWYALIVDNIYWHVINSLTTISVRWKVGSFSRAANNFFNTRKPLWWLMGFAVKKWNFLFFWFFTEKAERVENAATNHSETHSTAHFWNNGAEFQLCMLNHSLKFCATHTAKKQNSSLSLALWKGAFSYATTLHMIWSNPICGVLSV